MSNNRLHITVITPRRKETTTNKDEGINSFTEAINMQLARTVSSSLAVKLSTAINRAISIIAIFFQRVCARTPLDEPYDYVIEGKTYHHKPDNIQARMSWAIESGGKMLTSADLENVHPGLFDNYNDKNSIDIIKNDIKDYFGKDFDLKVSITNISPYFNVLEYGGYKEHTPHAPNVGDTKNHLLHGVENEHSIQAPVGMLRITEMEFENIAKTAKLTPLSTRYRKQVSTQLPNDARLKKFIDDFSANRRFSLKDIRRYLNV